MLGLVGDLLARLLQLARQPVDRHFAIERRAKEGHAQGRPHRAVKEDRHRQRVGGLWLDLAVPQRIALPADRRDQRIQRRPIPRQSVPLRGLGHARVAGEGLELVLETVLVGLVAGGVEEKHVRPAHPAAHLDKIRASEPVEGYTQIDADTSMSPGSFNAAMRAIGGNVAAVDAVLAGEARNAVVMTRPPGHHAARDQFGGYCFLNNVAIAAQYALDNGADKVAILDVDFHHGNGTQDIFYQRDDVLTLSLHGDPEHAFPYFLGRAEETGEGAGLGCNVNYPLPPGTRYPQWLATLQTAFERIQQFGAQYLVVSLGVDTFENDPISFFQLSSADFSDYGHHIGKLGLPTLFVMEGGYAVKDIGINTVNVLAGFEAAVGGN